MNATTGHTTPPAQTSAETRLKTWRTSNGLSLDDIADLTGLSKAMLSRVERGQRRLAGLTKAHVARCLDVPIRDLFDVPARPQEDSE